MNEEEHSQSKAITGIVGIIVAFLVLWYSSSKAQEIDQTNFRIHFTTVSYHFSDNDKYNNQNFGVGFEFGKKLRATTGLFLNSHNKVSVYAGGIWNIKEVNNWNFGLSAGLGTGYKEDISILGNKAVILPFGFGYVQWKGIRILVSPVVATLQIVVNGKE